MADWGIPAGSRRLFCRIFSCSFHAPLLFHEAVCQVLCISENGSANSIYLALPMTATLEQVWWNMSWNVNVYVYMNVCTSVYVDMCVYVSMHKYMYYVWMWICVCICLRICIYVCMYGCVYVSTCIYVCMCVYMSIYMYMCVCVRMCMYMCKYVFRMYICVDAILLDTTEASLSHGTSSLQLF